MSSVPPRKIAALPLPDSRPVRRPRRTASCHNDRRNECRASSGGRLFTRHLSPGVRETGSRSNELVYDGADRLSHLIWESRATVFTLGADMKLGLAWRIMANGAAGISGNSHMENYDWIDPYSPSYAFDDSGRTA